MLNFFRYTLSILVLFVIAACAHNTNSPEGVVKEFWTNISNNKVTDAIELIDTSDLDDSEVQIQKQKIAFVFGGLVSEMKTKGVDLSKVKIDNVTYSDDKNSATVDFSITAIGKTINQKMPVVKKDNEWKIKLK